MNGEEPTRFMMLSNDLVLSCLARVSRLYYPILSLVSKRFRSLLASTELYQTRTLLGLTETCLYVCLERHIYYSPQHWFFLCRRPNSSKKVLVPITSPNSPCTYQSKFASVGSSIYAISGINNDDNATCSVRVMDCGSHTWGEAPSMQVARVTPSVCVLDGKIYVTGGCENPNATNWMEVFDTKTQTWEFELSSVPSQKICSGFRYQSVGYGGNIYVMSFQKPATTYKLNNGRWRAGDIAMSMGWFLRSSDCVIENVLYSCSCGMINWYDFEERHWKSLKGLEDTLYRFPRYLDAKIADCGGKLAVLWEDSDEKVIWCAEIALEKRQEKNIWGTLVWADVVSTTNEPYIVAHLLAATL